MDKYQFGTATVIVDGDLTISINDGPVTLEIVQGYLDLVSSMHQKYGRCFLMVDATKIYPITKEARRYLAEWSKTHTITGTAIFGAGLVMRAALTLAARAMTLIGQQTNTVYVATESEARAWITDQRQRFLARQHNAAVSPPQ